MKRVFSLLLVFLVVFTDIPLSVDAQDDTVCPELPPAVVTTGSWARVRAGLGSNNLRDTPSLNGRLVTQIAPGTEFYVIDGPRCRDGYRWWLIWIDADTFGWTADGDYQSNWIEPTDGSGKGIVIASNILTGIVGAWESVPYSGASIYYPDGFMSSSGSLAACAGYYQAVGMHQISYDIECGGELDSSRENTLTGTERVFIVDGYLIVVSNEGYGTRYRKKSDAVLANLPMDRPAIEIRGFGRRVVYDTPDRSAGNIGFIDKNIDEGAYFTVTGRTSDNEWLQIDFDGGLGWIAAGIDIRDNGLLGQVQVIGTMAETGGVQRQDEADIAAQIIGDWVTCDVDVDGYATFGADGTASFEWGGGWDTGAWYGTYRFVAPQQIVFDGQIAPGNTFFEHDFESHVELANGRLLLSDTVSIPSCYRKPDQRPTCLGASNCSVMCNNGDFFEDICPANGQFASCEAWQVEACRDRGGIQQNILCGADVCTEVSGDGSWTGARLLDAQAIFINGINNTPETHRTGLKRVSETWNVPTMGIYNSTDGFVLAGISGSDVHQSIDDWLSSFDFLNQFDAVVFNDEWFRNPAIYSLIAALQNRTTGLEIDHLEIVAHSQGSIITSVALRFLDMQGYDLRNLTVTTLGGAGVRFPDGPTYHHYAFCGDPVAMVPGGGLIPGRRTFLNVDFGLYSIERVHSLDHYLEFLPLFEEAELAGQSTSVCSSRTAVHYYPANQYERYQLIVDQLGELRNDANRLLNLADLLVLDVTDGFELVCTAGNLSGLGAIPELPPDSSGVPETNYLCMAVDIAESAVKGIEAVGPTGLLSWVEALINADQIADDWGSAIDNLFLDDVNMGAWGTPITCFFFPASPTCSTNADVTPERIPIYVGEPGGGFEYLIGESPVFHLSCGELSAAILASQGQVAVEPNYVYVGDWNTLADASEYQRFSGFIKKGINTAWMFRNDDFQRICGDVDPISLSASIPAISTSNTDLAGALIGKWLEFSPDTPNAPDPISVVVFEPSGAIRLTLNVGEGFGIYRFTDQTHIEIDMTIQFNAGGIQSVSFEVEVVIRDGILTLTSRDGPSFYKRG